MYENCFAGRKFSEANRLRGCAAPTRTRGGRSRPFPSSGREGATGGRVSRPEAAVNAPRVSLPRLHDLSAALIWDLGCGPSPR
jgi:hypothetical protein